MTTISCRALISPDCLDGQPTREQFGEDYDDDVLDPPMSEDGTYDGSSIVCDPCYVALGAPPNEQLAYAILVARAKQVG
jgi:hypothetical protein